MSSLRAVKPIDCNFRTVLLAAVALNGSAWNVVVAAALPLQRQLVFLLLACHCDNPSEITFIELVAA